MGFGQWDELLRAVKPNDLEVSTKKQLLVSRANNKEIYV